MLFSANVIKGLILGIHLSHKCNMCDWKESGTTEEITLTKVEGRRMQRTISMAFTPT
jgi:hypothetical protein